MTVAEILKSVKFVTGLKGKKSTVLVNMAVWEQIVTMLEDAEDSDERRQARSVREEAVPWSAAKRELKLGMEGNI
jgi:hypothetical protein